MFVESKVELVDHMGDDNRACMAARVSLLNDELSLLNDEPGNYQDAAENPKMLSALFTKQQEQGCPPRNIKLINFLMREKHTSPFEHSVITFRVYAPLPVVAQIMRHRTFSYNQSSRRYTADQIEFFDMAQWRAQATKNLQCSNGALNEEDSLEINRAYQQHCVQSLELYEWALAKGCSREQARFMLPQGLMAKFYMTGSLHNFLKFIVLRDSEHAQEECAFVAREIREYLELLFPRTMEIFSELTHGSKELTPRSKPGAEN